MRDPKAEIRNFARAYKYNLKPVAVDRFAAFLDKYDTSEEYRRDLLRDLFNLVRDQCCDNRLVDEVKADAVISIQETKIRGCLGGAATSAVQVVSLEATPRVFVDEVSNDLKVGSSTAAVNRLQCLKQRYLMARRRCLRCGLYQKSVDQRLLGDGQLLPLLPTSALEGLDPSLQIAVLGLLIALEGDLFLEDLRGEVKLRLSDLSRVSKHCFIGHGFTVVVTGFWVNGVLHVARLDLPPAERREATLRDAGPSCDLFGLAPHDPVAALREEKAVQTVIIVMAHVHLDKAGVMSKLAHFFERMQGLGETELRDVTFVLTGDFSSAPLQVGDASHLPDIFDNADRLQTLLDGLGRCIAANAPTAAQQSHFVLLPGPRDLTALQGFVPQTAVAAHFAKGLESRTKRLTLAPNPCRLRFHTHEVVVARRDFLRELQRSEARFAWERYRRDDAGAGSPVQPAADTTLFERVAKTVLDEAHLAPSIDEAVLWRADDALRVPAAPHTMLLCDSTEQWECHYKGVHVVNPGSFAVSGTFLWYTPADGQCSLSTLE